MKYSTALVIFSILIAGGAGVYLFVNSGWYPAAAVNGTLVSAGLFEKELAAAFRYYSRVLSTYTDQSEVTPEELRKLREDLRAATLDNLVENILIEDKLEEIIGEELPDIVKKKLASVSLDSEKIPDAVTALYGLTLEEFKTLVLTPQAKREILEGRLVAQKQEYASVVQELRSKASVKIFLQGLFWNGQSVVLR